MADTTDTAGATDSVDIGDRLPTATGRRTAAVLWEALRGRRIILVLAAVFAGIAAALELIAPATLGRVVDDITNDAPSPLWNYALLIIVSIVGGGALQILGVLLAARSFERILAGLRERLVATALRLPQQRVERSGTGDLISRASDDVAQVSQALQQVVPVLSSTIFTLLLTIAGMSALDWRFGIILVVMLPVYWMTLRWYMRIAPPMYAAQRLAFGTRAHHLLSALRGVDTVTAFRLSDTHNRRIGRASWAVAGWALRARTVVTMFNWRIDVAFAVAVSVVLVLGFHLVGEGAVTVGAATTAVLFFLRLQGPIRSLMSVIDTLQLATASLARIVGVTDVDIHDSDVGRESARVAGTAGDSAGLDHVTFAYAEGPDVLHDVTVTIAPGEHLAVVGTSGAGKTTVAALLAGIHTADAGTVTAPDDTTLISQETHIFAATLRENLILAAPGTSDELINQAVAATGAQDLLDQMPQGLDTDLGPRGAPLTAAQSQHIALIRLLLADPALAILDEATAEAGSAHAHLLDHAADAALAGRTGMVIAHRLSQAASCDRILVMERGQVIEDGTHEELLAAGGQYSRLWAAQTQGN
ncbi:ABC-type transporter, ATPase subunit [Corynebacterium glyciniphilum AJ 3170]|uniref:ABC-type transporter, ATPase subunit n=1 Tax=Corynebacterium glyciniphilum AJ 3170 TaxID=1404245 RepID=X5DQL6_9CORY|nr:ABC transporter ATP-binding protein [Corynebacterium glyciniphilum]AHW65513.1 ABC-type transporter, ATPase subunit [Corynebacterium glyciniphilum AJ 3170]